MADYGMDDDALAAQPTGFSVGSMTGQVVVISGGAGGLGRATAWLMARIGAQVVLTGRDKAKLDACVARLTQVGLGAEGIVVDMRDPDAVAALIDGIWDRYGRLDLLINSAGGQFPSPALDISPKGWHAVIRSNLDSTWFAMQAAARRWHVEDQPGSIVNIVVVTRQGLHGIAHSVAARSGVVGLSQALAVEWAEYGIRVNCIAPGTIETAGWNAYTPDVVAKYPGTNPMMRVGSAWDVAEAVTWLGGPMAGYVTGEVVNVAGGSQLWGETWTIPRPEWFAGPSE